MLELIELLCNAGLSLVAIPPKSGKPTKAPNYEGWNRQRNANNPKGYSNNAADFTNCNGFNFGLYHGASHTLALDMDDVALTRKVFEDTTDLELLAWLENDLRVEIKSPKANHGKLLFKLPTGFDDTGLHQFKHKGKVIFELRTGNCQDVIYGKHPEGGEYQLIGNPAAIPEAPAVLQDILCFWDDWKACFDSALGIDPEPPEIAPQQPQQGEHLDGRRDPIKEFNQSYSMTDVLIRNGYKSVGKDRFIRPGSSSKAPGVVIMRNCLDGIERVYSHSGDVLNDGFAHDMFDCYRVIEYGGNWDKALAWNPEITKHNQRLFMQEQAKKGQQQPQQHESNIAHIRKYQDQSKSISRVETPLPFSLNTFSLNGNSKTMELKMLDDEFVLARIAILGQATAIYAKPNTGKTLLILWLLIQAIISKAIKGDDVFYINADDSYKGVVQKLKLAEQYGFKMLAPGHCDFESTRLLEYMQLMVKEESASGKIIILDTLKKFTNLMDKKTASDFMRGGREFVANGGTLILLAHTNKNRNGEGKVIFCGTSDIVDDVDCAYTLDEVEAHGSKKRVLFENIKSRGDVCREIAYSYAVKEGQTYNELLDSVEVLDEEAVEQARKGKAIDDKLNKNKTAIDAIIEAIELGHTLKTDLLEVAHKDSGISKSKLSSVLNEHTGKSLECGHRWQVTKGDKNAKNYCLLTPAKPILVTTVGDYRTAKQG
ncbi:conserved hypothetical protein [Candidatus Methylobacter favarea]|uniref:DNA primase/polymerase bifunctional N-terminal domain-containing protein n=1 Tax=Candidatus Methylobacter favarea TaxID=2707345 RepID=A0A8S0XHP4_9GAMM|nr:bifunctional DNA primase/polymerase [Candidatus Methylobacter favarea]CAA9892003.1 conserved hypothetical protein [Candidatus Methylobacter favarea]